MKVARRTLNNTWTHPITQRDAAFIAHLRAQGAKLDRQIQDQLNAPTLS